MLKCIKFQRCFVIPALLVLICGVPGKARSDLYPAGLPSLVESIRINSSIRLFGEPVPLDNMDVRERLEKELVLSLWNRAQIVLWIKRSTRYFPYMEKIFKASRIPRDFKFMAVVESALLPYVHSNKGAVGFWQFRKSTGRRYGLKIDSRLDERRDIFASTRAAAAYLKELYDIFGSWTLSAAAYNMGEEGLQSEILVQQTQNYFKLYLPLETQRFIFKIIAAKLILTHPEKYGFELKQSDLYPPLKFDRVELKVSRKVSLQNIAQAAKVYFKQIKDLNPQIRGYYLFKGTHHILVPEGAAKGFHQRLQGIMKNPGKSDRAHIYTVKPGDSLSKIAAHFDVPLPALLLWNQLDHRKPIHPGERLVIYPDKASN